jgi:AcrR family transcriptional regulator
MSERSRRKVRATKPVQSRSVQRFDLLLRATDELLSEREPRDVGIYDIADRAGVAPASVYHFFPSKEAAFLALAERYLTDLALLGARAHDPSSLRNWPDLLELAIHRAIDFYNEHPVFRKLFLGGGVSADIREREVAYNALIAENGYDWMQRYFLMPYLPDPAMRFSVIWSIFDGICVTSQVREGLISDAFRAQAVMAVIAYCRTFLPDVVPLRPPEPA